MATEPMDARIERALDDILWREYATTPNLAAALAARLRDGSPVEAAAKLMAESGGHSPGCAMVSEGWDPCDYCDGIAEYALLSTED